MIRLEQAEKQYKNFHRTGKAGGRTGRDLWKRDFRAYGRRPEEDWRGLVRCWIFRIPHGKRSDCRIKKYVSGI